MSAIASGAGRLLTKAGSALRRGGKAAAKGADEAVDAANKGPGIGAALGGAALGLASSPVGLGITALFLLNDIMKVANAGNERAKLDAQLSLQRLEAAMMNRQINEQEGLSGQLDLQDAISGIRSPVDSAPNVESEILTAGRRQRLAQMSVTAQPSLAEILGRMPA